jgi:hypothetical protein
MLFTVLLIVLSVDDTHDPAHNLISSVSQQHNYITILKGFVLFGRKEGPIVRVKRRYPVRMIPVNLSRQVNEFFQILPGANRLHKNVHKSVN